MYTNQNRSVSAYLSTIFSVLLCTGLAPGSFFVDRCLSFFFFFSSVLLDLGSVVVVVVVVDGSLARSSFVALSRIEKKIQLLPIDIDEYAFISSRQTYCDGWLARLSGFCSRFAIQILVNVCRLTLSGYGNVLRNRSGILLVIIVDNRIIELTHNHGSTLI
jgi:hypothetical protein